MKRFTKESGEGKQEGNKRDEKDAFRIAKVVLACEC